MNHAIDLALQRQQFGFGLAGRVGHVVMQVAIAQVAEDDVAHARKARLQQGIGLVHEAGDGRNGNGHVVLDRLAQLGFGQRNAFAQMPQRLALRHIGGNGGVMDQASVDGLAQHGFEAVTRVRLAFAIGQFQQREPGGFGGVALERQALLREQAHHPLQAGVAHEFETRQRRTETGARARQHFHGLVDGVERQQRGAGSDRAGKQFQCGGRDDA
ncbi:hypothetical protein D3C71_1628260 [compost metagenome]